MKIFKRVSAEVKATRQLLHDVPGVLTTVFVLSLVMMNLLANKSIDVGVTWLALDAGILVSWIAFLSMDILVKSFGPKASTRLTFVATGMNVAVAAVFALAAAIGGVWGESFCDAGEAVNAALDGTFAGTWYVLLGSTIAFLVSAVVNAVLNWLVGRLFKRNPDGFIAYAVRSYVSTAIAQFVDNLLFSLIVSLNFFGWSLLQCITCSITGALVELICEVVFSPIGFAVAKRWAREGIGTENIGASLSR